MDEALLTAAWAVLVPEWLLRWTIILSVGALPWLAERWFWMRRRPAPHNFYLFRKSCALGACLLSLWSFQLAADTYAVESESVGALETRNCRGTQTASETAERTAPVNLECQDGSTFTQVPRSAGVTADTGVTKGKLYLLSRTGSAVLFTQE